MSEMSNEAKARIKAKRKTNRDLLSNYRMSLDQDLYQYCTSLGGHDWSDWSKQYLSLYSPGYDRWQETRHCFACGKDETREIEEEVARIKTETGVDISLD